MPDRAQTVLTHTPTSYRLKLQLCYHDSKDLKVICNGFAQN